MNGTQVCSNIECDTPAYVRGMCSSHYSHWIHDTPASKRPRPTVDQRFDAMVQSGAPDDCWEWMGGKTRSGYGRFRAHDVRMITSRFALQRAVGEPESPDLIACHTCDNPPCCNPAHLFWGTQTENCQDSMIKGRKAKGEGTWTSKLTEELVLQIRAEVLMGKATADMAIEYGVSRVTISSVARGHTWKYLNEVPATGEMELNHG